MNYKDCSELRNDIARKLSGFKFIENNMVVCIDTDDKETNLKEQITYGKNWFIKICDE